MRELRYRMFIPSSDAHPFAAWFRRAPEGYVHGADIRFEGDIGTGTLLATMEDGDFAGFEEDLLRNPMPTATRWEVVDRCENLLRLAIAWREPIFPGINSPMRDAWDFLGPETLTSYWMTRDAVVHRNLVPEHVVLEPFWFRVRDQSERFTATMKLPLVVHLERLGPWIPSGRLEDEEGGRLLVLAAYHMGYWDTPPRANLQDLALVTGIPADVVLGHLKDAESAILDARRRPL